MPDRTRTSRQSFLGPRAQETIQSVRVGILGLGGGGSHVAQQLAHVGFKHFFLCDPDVVEDTNLNRLVGATAMDAELASKKVDVAARTIVSLNPDAAVTAQPQRWELVAELLRQTDVVFGCLDSYAARRDLESFARRYLIPLIDIGLDVATGSAGLAQMSGQLILSMPSAPCMWCMGFLNDVTLAEEARRYGDAGVRPQVVWSNGVLASLAVGIAVDLFTGWTRSSSTPIYLEYDANTGTVQPSVRLRHLPKGPCLHFPPEDVGRPVFAPL